MKIIIKINCDKNTRIIQKTWYSSNGSIHLKIPLANIVNDFKEFRMESLHFYADRRQFSNINVFLFGRSCRNPADYNLHAFAVITSWVETQSHAPQRIYTRHTIILFANNRLQNGLVCEYFRKSFPLICVAHTTHIRIRSHTKVLIRLNYKKPF